MTPIRVEDLEGAWRVERSFEFDRGGGPARFTGRTIVEPTGEGRWLWREEGRVETARGPVRARRQYWVVPAGASALDLYFADDGSPPSARTRFVRLVSDGSGGLSGEHRCGADLYVGAYRQDPDGSVRIEWRIDGPRKRGVIRSHLTRETEAGSGRSA